MKTAAGAFVIHIDPDSPAAAAGLALCDLIVRINGKSLQDYGDHRAFRYAMREAAMFSSASLEVLKYEPANESYVPRKVEFRIPARLGAPSGLETAFHIMVLEVRQDGPAQRAGVRSWDFIDEIEGAAVANMRSVVEADIRVNEFLSRTDSVRLSLARWRPLPPASEQRVTYLSREVTLSL